MKLLNKKIKIHKKIFTQNSINEIYYLLNKN